jgi:hypothetical protein
MATRGEIIVQRRNAPKDSPSWLCCFLLLVFSITRLAAGPPRPQDASAAASAACSSLRGLAIDEMNRRFIAVSSTFIPPGSVADAFGKRIARRSIALQVTVVNRNSEYPWLVQDALIDVSKLMGRLESRAECGPNLDRLLESIERFRAQSGPAEPDDAAGHGGAQIGSAGLPVLRGIAEKGQALDARNLALRILRGAGSVAAGLIGMASFGPSFAPAVALFNGPFLSAYASSLPDFTITQMSRLDDSAFPANTVIGKQQGRTFVLFLPVEYLLTSRQEKPFYKNPESVFGCADPRLLEARVRGTFIATAFPDSSAGASGEQ